MACTTRLIGQEFFIKSADRALGLGLVRDGCFAEAMEAHTLELFLKHRGWNTLTRTDGDISYIERAPSEADDSGLWTCLAPVVQAGSYLQLLDRDGSVYWYVFDGKACRVERAPLLYGPPPSMQQAIAADVSESVESDDFASALFVGLDSQFHDAVDVVDDVCSDASEVLQRMVPPHRGLLELVPVYVVPETGPTIITLRVQYVPTAQQPGQGSSRYTGPQIRGVIADRKLILEFLKSGMKDSIDCTTRASLEDALRRIFRLPQFGGELRAMAKTAGLTLLDPRRKAADLPDR